MALEQAGLRAQSAPDELPNEDQPPLVVPGYEVVSLTNLGQGTTPIGVHVVQRFEGDELFEIYRLQPETELSVLPARAEGTNEVRVLVEFGWIVMRGPLSEEELEGLLARLVPEG